jgi:methyl-accepting chemotaxis protein
MSEQSLSTRLSEWAGDKSDGQSELARKLSKALTDKFETTLWSSLDLRAEFENRAADDSKLVKIFAQLLPISYLLPIALTWWHLRSALTSFQTASSMTRFANTNFISYWTGSVDGFQPGKKLQDVALQIVFALGLILFIHIVTRKMDSSRLISSELEELLLESQLQIAQRKAVTPQDIADSLTVASQKLEEALTKTSTAMQSMSSFSKTISDVVNGLQGVTNSLDTSAGRVESAVAPLMKLPSSLNDVMHGLTKIGTQIADTQAHMNTTTVNAFETAETMKGFLKLSGSVSADVERLMEKIQDAGKVSIGFVDTISKASGQASDLANLVENYSPHIVALSEIAQSFRDTTKSLGEVAGEFKIAADEYEQVNTAYRSNQ